ncbi:MAG: sulfatase-like hydrolase/transferase [Verrucomicrobiales bacterium]|nr:sulfatase-like hydrolase/transferase [Verrucomicrobiales bacterium]
MFLNRCFILAAAFSVLSLTLFAQEKEEGELEKPEPPADPPNIVMIFIDDMGYADPSCFGNPKMKTPHIDRLAAEGLKLTNFYVNSPICSASRVALTTGQYPARWGVHSYLNSRKKNAERGMKNYLSAGAPTTAKMLKKAGYATAHFGKWHMGGGRDVDDAPLPKAYGFDESLVSFEGLGDRLIIEGNGLAAQSEKLGKGKLTKTPKHKTTEIYVDRSIDFIERNKDGKFYLRMFPNDVHDAFIPAPGEQEKWADVTENPEEQKFFAVLAEMDRQIGRLVKRIDELGLAEKTLIIFTSDNGPTDWPRYYRSGLEPPGFTGQYFGRKWSLFEGGIRMPFIARWKGKVPEGRTDSTSPVAAIDLSPTFAKLTGAEIPEGVTLDGVDQSSVLLGGASGRSKSIFWQYGAPHAKLMPGNPKFHSPSLAVRDGDFKLLINRDGTDAHLFNLIEDPREENNLVKSQPAKAAELFGKIKVWAVDVGLEIEEAATPQLPLERPESLAISINGKTVEGKNKGVRLVDRRGMMRIQKGNVIDFAKADSPDVIGKEIQITVELIETESKRGVIVAQGGNRNGYSLYLKGGRVYFSVCRDWKRTIAASKYEIKSYPAVLEARLLKGGRQEVLISGYTRGTAEAKGLLEVQPGDGLQVGSDLIQPAGDYESPFPFDGVIRKIKIDTAKPPVSERFVE